MKGENANTFICLFCFEQKSSHMKTERFVCIVFRAENIILFPDNNRCVLPSFCFVCIENPVTTLNVIHKC